jgi:hypothetical protein
MRLGRETMSRKNSSMRHVPGTIEFVKFVIKPKQAPKVIPPTGRKCPYGCSTVNVRGRIGRCQEAPIVGVEAGTLILAKTCPDFDGCKLKAKCGTLRREVKDEDGNVKVLILPIKQRPNSSEIPVVTTVKQRVLAKNPDATVQEIKAAKRKFRQKQRWASRK